MAKPFLSVVIPAYNEAKRIPLTLIDVDKHLRAQDFSYEIIVVNDGSRDATAEIVSRFIPLVRNLKLIDNKVNRGKGAVVRQGMQAAKGAIRLFTDADNSTSIDQFNKMLPHFKEGYDVVIGSRDVPGARLEPPQRWYKRLFGNLGNLFIQTLLLRGIWDTQCGFKAFREEAVEEIFPMLKIDRWGFDIEILSLAKALGYRVKEIPVVWVNDPFSHLKLTGYLQVLWETVKIRWWLSRGKYPLRRQELPNDENAGV
ncbi:MAG: glycosyltransferase family 2 protein [bacterium]|nr:glycosyltransferase family 2 protein [bacterium]